jgi:hypothetical protein
VRRGVTLIELLIATALGIMLIGVAAMIFMQSQDMFMETNKRVGLAVQMRGALSSVRRDLTHSANTVELEFYTDGNGDSLYTPGEELGNQDPLPGPFGSANSAGYSYSMGLCTATYTRTAPPAGSVFRADALYFRADPGRPKTAHAVEYRLLNAGPKVQFVRRTFEQATPGGGVTASTEVLLDDVLSLSFEFQNAGGAWVDASAGPALGLRSVPGLAGSVVEMCFEGTGTFNPAQRSLTVPYTAGLAALRPGSPVHLSGGPLPGEFTIEDLVVQGSNALITFEQRLGSTGGNTPVSWRAPWLPASIRARLIMRSRSAENTVSAESVFRIR